MTTRTVTSNIKLIYTIYICAIIYDDFVYKYIGIYFYNFLILKLTLQQYNFL